MSSKAEPMDQVKFLVSCIKHATNGRPDFTAVAKELDIVSKAAAQKRYERMLKANNVSGKPDAKPSSEDEVAPKTPAKSPAKTPAKRKAAPKVSANKNKKAKTAKKEESEEEDTKPASSMASGTMKEEDDESPLSEPPESVEGENDN